MKKRGRAGRLANTVIGGALFGLLIYLVKNVDVAEIGPKGTSIGLSTVNELVHNYTGVNMLWYNITYMLGAAALLIAFCFAVFGLMQLITRRSLLKVDREIIALGFLYAVTVGLYVFFEKYVINYRPIIMPDATAPESSFPSSHTMLICVVMGSTVMLIGRYVKNGFLRWLLICLCTLVCVVTVIGRLICGVHWFTDIVGGVLISLTLLSLYSEIIHRYPKPREKE